MDLRIVWRFTFLVVLPGCLGKEPPVPIEIGNSGNDVQKTSDLISATAEAELRTLILGGASQSEKSRLLEERKAYLTGLIEDPTKNAWQDDNSTRDACLVLEAQLSALAIGRGLAMTADEVRPRMERLRSLLKSAGYDFDERGLEQKWGEDGNQRKGYTPLLHE